MRQILVAGLIVASAAFTGAQVNQTPRSDTFSTSTTPVSLQVGRGEQRPNGMFLQNVTLTVGDLLITADDAMLIGDQVNPEFQLGANARVRFTPK